MSATETPVHAASQSDDLRAQLHDFHLTGRPLDSADALGATPLRPIAVDALPDPPHSFPLCFEPTGQAGFRPLGELLEETFSAGGFDLLRGRAAAPARLVAEWLSREGVLEAPLLEAIEACLSELSGQPELREEDSDAVEAEGRRLLTRLPRTARALAFSASSAVLLHVRIQADSRRTAQAALAERAQRLLQRLEGMLLHGGEPEGAAQLATELGGQGDRFLDVGALARSLRRTPGHQALDPERRERIETAAKTLRGFVERASSQTMISVLHSPAAPAEVRVPGTTWIEVNDPVQATLERARGDFDWFSDVLRALRLGALEAEHDYQPAKHARALARLDWRAGTRDEVAAAPLCIAVDTARNLSEGNLTALGRALRSGLPLQVLALDDSGTAAAPDLGYLAMAHRDAFVFTAPLAAAQSATDGFVRMSRALRPALASVAVPPSTGRTAARLVQSQAAWRARLTPVLLYDPDNGESWEERFSLAGNPDPASVFAGVTPADAAALDPDRRGSFAVLPEDTTDADLIPLADYLEQSAERASAATPFILIRGLEGRPARAAITRELANSCRDTRRAWRIYQDLGRAGSQQPGLAPTKAGAENGNEQDRIVSEARQQGAKEAVYRLVAALAGSTDLPQTLSQAAAPTPTRVSESQREPPLQQQAPEPAAAKVGPYIDSALCTSCNECINRNPKMFRYNDDKQAYIADAKAGTYAQLLKAAAACPAQCIHPGPAPG